MIVKAFSLTNCRRKDSINVQKGENGGVNILTNVRIYNLAIVFYWLRW